MQFRAFDEGVLYWQRDVSDRYNNTASRWYYRDWKTPNAYQAY